jgi:hypothetical protein
MLFFNRLMLHLVFRRDVNLTVLWSIFRNRLFFESWHYRAGKSLHLLAFPCKSLAFCIQSLVSGALGNLVVYKPLFPESLGYCGRGSFSNCMVRYNNTISTTWKTRERNPP